MAKNSNDVTKVITGKARSTMMFVNELGRSKKDKDDVTAYCGTGILIRKKDKKTVRAIEAAIEAASQAKFGKKARKNSAKFNYPLRDCDAEIANGDFEPENPEEFAGCFYLRAKTWRVPGLVDQFNKPVDDVDDRKLLCYSGNYFRFSINFIGFENESEGIRVQLNNMMFVEEGERMDGGSSATSDFEDFAEDEVDEDDDEDEEEEEQPVRKSRRSLRKRK